MVLGEFVGNEHTKLSLLAAISCGRLSHGLVIAGQKGFGVNCFARLLAAEIVGKTPGEKQLVLKGESPLVQVITGEGASGQIKVAQIRAVGENVNFSSLSGDKRVVIICNCENFNPASANALLKSLEEPKDDITFILTTNDVSRLLATVRSRCGVYTLEKPTVQECESFFSFVKDKEMLKELIEIYDGNIGFIQNAAKNPKRFEILQKALLALELIKKRDKYELSKLLFDFNKKKDNFKLFLEDLEYLSQKNIDGTTVKVLTAIKDLKQSFGANANLALVLQNFVIAV
ncbi:MAG: hypothetical protein RR011_02660 [Oscillospiraceae bacterium]